MSHLWKSPWRSFAWCGLIAVCSGATAAAQPTRRVPSPAARLELPAVVVRARLQTTVHVAIDLQTSQISTEVGFINRDSAAIQLEVGAPPVQVALRPGGTERTSRTEKVASSRPAGGTGTVRVDPRIRVRQGPGTPALLASQCEFDIELILPANGRVLRSSIPFRPEAGGRLRWRASGLTVAGPFSLVYTTAPERVALTKQIAEDGRQVTVRIVIRNEGTSAIPQVELRAQFPNGTYEIDEAGSSGRFRLIDDQMVRWSGTVRALAPQAAIELVLSLTKPSVAAPFVDFDVLAYAGPRNLIAIAPASR